MIPNIDGLHTDAPRQTLESLSSYVFLELYGEIAKYQKLEDLLAARFINKAVSSYARTRIEHLRPTLQCLRVPPFKLTWSQILYLKELDLSNKSIGRDDMRKFAAAIAIGALPLLQMLNLSYNIFGAAGIRLFATALGNGALPLLKTLYLTGNSFGDEGMATFSCALCRGALPKLEKLILRRNEFRVEGMRAFTASIDKGAVPLLQNLDISATQIGDQLLSPFFAALVRGAPVLMNLDLSASNFGADGMKAFAAALLNGALKHLTILDLSNNTFGDEGMATFSDALLRGALLKLEKLSLTRNEFRVEGVRAFTSAIDKGALQCLKFLKIAENAIGDDGMLYFATVIGNKEALPKLEELILTYPSIGDQAWRALNNAANARVPHLQTRSYLIDRLPLGPHGLSCIPMCKSKGFLLLLLLPRLPIPLGVILPLLRFLVILIGAVIRF